MLAYISRLPPLTDENRTKGPYALVLAPTRELAQQIESETNKFCRLLGYRCVSIVGGKAIEEQQFNMRDGAEIIIATPGRLKDCIERSVLVLGQCTYVVMDEADRMVSMGFEEVLNFILDSLPVTNIKPDSQEAEDGEKMNMMISAPQGMEEEVAPTLALYRQTVRRFLILIPSWFGTNEDLSEKFTGHVLSYYASCGRTTREEVLETSCDRHYWCCWSSRRYCRTTSRNDQQRGKEEVRTLSLSIT